MRETCYLMAVHNNPQGLLVSLASLFADAPVDIVIVDDGSTLPLTLPVAPQGFHLHLIRLEKNGGIAEALNAGLVWILAQNYSFIARLDAGDTVRSGRLAAQCAYMKDHAKAGVLGTQMHAVDKNGGALFDIRNPVAAKKYLPLRNVLAHPSVMIRASALSQVGLYSAGYFGAEDYELWQRIARRYEVANLAEFFVDKKMSFDQITTRHRARCLRSRLKIQVKYFKFFSLYAWFGLLRSLLAFFVPRRGQQKTRAQSGFLQSPPGQENVPQHKA